MNFECFLASFWLEMSCEFCRSLKILLARVLVETINGTLCYMTFKSEILDEAQKEFNLRNYKIRKNFD